MNWLHRIKHLFEHRALVLMYHRVADAPIDVWDLAVSPENFAQQVQHLVSQYNVISVPELIQNLHPKKLPARTVCLTFDDGYADNYLFARPVLEQYRCPATFFIPTHFTGQQQPFWWDELAALLLETPELPELFQMPIADETVTLHLEADAVLTDVQIKKHKAWRWPAPPPTARCQLYLNVWEQLKPLPYSEIEAAMEAIRNWVGYQPTFSNAQLPMDHEQLWQLSQSNLFTIGLHTATHAALAYHAEDVQYQELAENKKALQPFQPVNAIAFPYGNYNNSTLAVVQRQQLDAAFTTDAKPVSQQARRDSLGRFQVRNNSGTAFESSLRQWQQT